MTHDEARSAVSSCCRPSSNTWHYKSNKSAAIWHHLDCGLAWCGESPDEQASKTTATVRRLHGESRTSALGRAYP